MCAHAVDLTLLHCIHLSFLEYTYIILGIQRKLPKMARSADVYGKLGLVAVLALLAAGQAAAGHRPPSFVVQVEEGQIEQVRLSNRDTARACNGVAPTVVRVRCNAGHKHHILQPNIYYIAALNGYRHAQPAALAENKL